MGWKSPEVIRKQLSVKMAHDYDLDVDYHPLRVLSYGSGGR
jgi:hypothetical protein